MWGKILVSLALLVFINCTATVTCDPKLANPGCPDGRVCDPTGICQLTCNSSIKCTDPDATICDTSSFVAFLCQRDATTPSGCPTGQTPVNLPTSDAEKAAGTNKVVCKLECSGSLNSSCASGPNSPTQYTCQIPTSGNGDPYCWGSQS
jgi:hypothetical protein